MRSSSQKSAKAASTHSSPSNLAEIASGAVVSILDQFLPPDQPFHLYYANRAHTPTKLRAFIEFMQTANRKGAK